MTEPHDADHADDGERDEADDPILRSMRSVWVSMREEDPPAKGLTELLSAARAKAEEMQPKESWWRRMFAAAVRPPMLALATVIVLVGGAVLISKRGPELDTTPQATPTRQNETLAFERERGTTTELQKSAVKEKLERDVTVGQGSASVTEAVVAPEPPKPLAKPPVVHVPPPSRPRLEPAPEATHPGLVEPGVKTPVVTTDVPGDSTGLQIAEGAPAGRQENPPADPKPSVDVKHDAVKGDGPQQGRGLPTIEQLVKQAEAAAERKDCPAVRATVNRIKKLDTTVYKARVVKQAAIARCLQ